MRTKIKKQKMYRLNAADAVVAVLVLVVSVVPVFSFAGQGGKTASIYIEGRQAEKVDLGSDKAINLKSMLIEVQKGRVRVAKSDCPRQICSHTGWISAAGQTIVCVPNRVLVEIKNNGGRQDLNAVSY